MAELIIEILDRHERVLERHKVVKFPCRIGRGYSNDLILSDPYVCPDHVVVNSDANGWVVDDLDSRNGLFFKNNYKPVKSIDLTSGEEVYIGKTLIRFVSADHPVKPSSKLKLPKKKKGPIVRKVEFFGALIVCFIFFFISQFLNKADAVSMGKQVAMTLLVFPFVIIWAALWSFLSRVTKQKLYFSIHLEISVWFIVSISMCNILLDFIEYNIIDLGVSSLLRIFVCVLVSCLFLIQHLKVSTVMSKIKIRVVSSIISFGIVFGFFLFAYVLNSEFESNPQFSTIIKPPFTRLVSSKKIDDFFKDNEALFKKFED